MPKSGCSLVPAQTRMLDRCSNMPFDLLLWPIAMISGCFTFPRPTAMATSRNAQSSTRFSDQSGWRYGACGNNLTSHTHTHTKTHTYTHKHTHSTDISLKDTLNPHTTFSPYWHWYFYTHTHTPNRSTSRTLDLKKYGTENVYIYVKRSVLFRNQGSLFR